MRKTYESPDTELVPVTVANFFCSSYKGPSNSDQSLQSYSYGGTWGEEDE